MNKNTGDGERQKTNTAIEQFAKDFNIDYESYKYNEKTLVVTFTCVDASPSEISYYSWSVPAFVISTYQHKIAQEANKAQQNLLQELMEQWQQYNEYDPETLSDEPVNAVPLSVIQNKLEGLS